ncbi:MAG: transcriptional regulator [Nocardioidaceae bacterium]
MSADADAVGSDPNQHDADPMAIDRVVHEPARMAILSVLDGVEEADFVFLQRALGLTKGNLSAHLTKLENAGLVASSKAFVNRVPRTRLRITTDGKRARGRHWEQLQALRHLGDG